MSKRNLIIDAVNDISGYITQGLEINIDIKSNVKMVYVRNPRNGKAVKFNFEVPIIGTCKIVKWEDIIDQQPAAPVKSLPDKGMPTVATIAEKKKTSKWWSRFHFEQNIMKMTLLALQDRFPNEVGYRQDTFTARLAAMMSWQESTAKRHIARAAKMGILNRAVIGTSYYITGVNTDDEEILEDYMQRAADGDKVADACMQGVIDFDRNTVDETVIP